jgi:hypothetical protein
MDIDNIPAPLLAEITLAWTAAEGTDFKIGHGSCEYFARGYAAARSERTLETRAGAVVSFDDPARSTEGQRLVATCVPGGISEDGALEELTWTDAWGSGFHLEDIRANNPIVLA